MAEMEFAITVAMISMGVNVLAALLVVTYVARHEGNIRAMQALVRRYEIANSVRTSIRRTVTPV